MGYAGGQEMWVTEWRDGRWRKDGRIISISSSLSCCLATCHSQAFRSSSCLARSRCKALSWAIFLFKRGHGKVGLTRYGLHHMLWHLCDHRGPSIPERGNYFAPLAVVLLFFIQTILYNLISIKLLFQKDLYFLFPINASVKVRGLFGDFSGLLKDQKTKKDQKGQKTNGLLNVMYPWLL